MLLGKSQLAANHLRAWMKVTVDMSRTSSRWIARMTQHVNKQIHTLLHYSPLSLPMYIGPAKLTAMYVNGGALVTLKEWGGGAGWESKGLTSNHLQTTHLWSQAWQDFFNYPVLACSSNFTKYLLHSIVLHPLVNTSPNQCRLSVSLYTENSVFGRE